jgi:hypothetical protein
MNLRPPETVFRFLFSSPAHFAGECEGKQFWFTLAFPSFDRRGRESLAITPSAFRRSHLCLSIDVPERDKSANVYPMYSWVGEEMSALVGAFYGKLVVNFGHMQAGKLMTVPSIQERPFYRFDKPPFNDQARQPNGVELNLGAAAVLVRKYIAVAGDDPELPLLVRGAEFYRVALESYAEQPEIAFAMLIASLEVLTGLRKYSEDELYDETLLSDLRTIAQRCSPEIASRLKKRLWQIKRKVASLVCDAVPDAFFDQRETTLTFGFMKDRAELVDRIRAAYDVRSRLLHTGDRSGLWYIEHDHQGAEIGLGKPVLPDRDLVKLLCRSVNLVGLERITSTVLRVLLDQWLGK